MLCLEFVLGRCDETTIYIYNLCGSRTKSSCTEYENRNALVR